MSGFIVVNGTQSMRKLLRKIQLRDYKSSLILNKFLSLSRFGDTPASGCRIKGNPVRIRNSARYCDAHILRILFKGGKESISTHTTVDAGRQGGKVAF